MDLYQISEFSEELVRLRPFFLKLNASKSKLNIHGFQQISKWKEYEAARGVLPKLETNLTSVVRHARYLHPELFSRLEDFVKDSPLTTRANEIAIAIEIAEAEENSVADSFDYFVREVFSKVFKIFTISGHSLDEGAVPLRRLMVDLDRLIPMVEELSELVFSRENQNDEIFHPSGVNIEEIKKFVDEAISNIHREPSLDQKSREDLILYLEDTRAELVKDSPNWKKLVGALVIVSTILVGLAVAPEALKNVDSAVRYILGTSVELSPRQHKHGPRFLPPSIEI